MSEKSLISQKLLKNKERKLLKVKANKKNRLRLTLTKVSTIHSRMEKNKVQTKPIVGMLLSTGKMLLSTVFIMQTKEWRVQALISADPTSKTVNCLENYPGTKAHETVQTVIATKRRMVTGKILKTFTALKIVWQSLSKLISRKLT